MQAKPLRGQKDSFNFVDGHWACRGGVRGVESFKDVPDYRESLRPPHHMNKQNEVSETAGKVLKVSQGNYVECYCVQTGVVSSIQGV
eukprot:851518-Amphidinium_carterae.2